jgi:hypothetical protein
MNHDDFTTPWRESSYSNSGANCVKVAMTGSGKVQAMTPHSLGPWAAAPRGG